MKCPECGFAFSDLRDICPRCKQDVRPFKRSKGIAVTSPDAPYEELLRSFGGGQPAKSSPREPRSIFDTLKKLFQSVEEGPSEPARDPLSQNQEEVPISSRPSSTTPIREEVLSRPDSLPSSQDLEVSSAGSSEQNPKESVEVAKFFEEAYQDLSEVGAEDFEIGAAALLSESTSEHIQLLFNLAEQSFRDASVEARFQETGLSSETRTVTSQEVQARLEQAEAALRAPAFSLKETFRRRSQVLRDEGDEKRPQFPVATRRERFISWGGDLAILMLLGCVGGLLLSYLEYPDLLWLAFSLDAAALSGVGRVYLMGNALTLFLFSFLLYPILCAVFFGNATFGSRLVQCRFFRLTRRRPALYEHIHLRFLLLPFTSVLMIPSLLMRKLLSSRSGETNDDLLLSDHWSGTVLCSLGKANEKVL